ncbi:cation efflux protein, CzcI-like, partial [Acinetobacter sp. A11]
HELSQIYYWSNSYQSPYLGSLNPPPVLTLL